MAQAISKVTIKRGAFPGAEALVVASARGYIGRVWRDR